MKQACCTIPPIKAEYSPVGSYEVFGGFKTYKTGPADAISAIFIVYDIFGFCPQILQGADLLAQLTNSQVFIPDLLKGEVADFSWVPPDTEEKMKSFNAFIQGPASIPSAVSAVPTIIRDITERIDGKITKWGALGFCWGYKIVAGQSGAGTPFVAAAGAHPSFISPEDATTITVPFCILPSKDEDHRACKEFESRLKVDKHIETFMDMPHGWMAARGDLDDVHCKVEFERGYNVVGTFLNMYLS
ncbi:dienelactone hydrolase [Corynespora cassiicola Philippines]|uniref:Dienelactone hydrolase n=1 Tax=Corynespora cassiicola Philippines TaxID=1448308 RepID=A0A2T2N1S3_CORCC|nr:dienelactone hydrolase [Corynespora cassiicola Philippines]